MREGVPEVAPRSRRAIDVLADSLAKDVSPETVAGLKPFPIREFCEFGKMEELYGITFDVQDLGPGLEGRTIDNQLVLSSHVYDNLCCDDPRARFTLAHDRPIYPP